MEVICFSDGRLYWDVQFSCLVQDWESESLALFMDTIYSTFVQGVLSLIEVVGSWLRVKGLRFEDFIIPYIPFYYQAISLENGLRFYL